MYGGRTCTRRRSLDVLNIHDFCNAPSLEQLKARDLRKEDWKSIAKHLEVPITTQITKNVLKNVVIEYLVNNNALEEEAIEHLTPMSTSRVAKALSSLSDSDSSSNSQLELERLKLEYQLNMQEMLNYKCKGKRGNSGFRSEM